MCSGGEVFDQILERGNFTEADAAAIIKQVLIAINYCHSNNIVHRDLKPENLVYREKDSDDIKVIDFGTSGLYDPTKKMSETQGTSYYIAPEVLKGNYTEKCDLWSIGAMTYVLLVG
jgi:calcium-dependent protein kinase